MSDRSMMTAETVGSAARFDPQLRIPRRPRLRRGLAVGIEADQVVVTGPPKKQLFRGRSATEMLPGLLALLDGKRTHDRLAAELGLPEEVVFKALSLLWTCGVVEEGPPLGTAGEAVPDVDDQLADYLSRVGSATEVNPCWEEAATRLRTAEIEVFGDPALAALLRDELTGSMRVTLGIGDTPSEGTTLAVRADTSAGAGRDVLAEHCWDKGIPLLRLRVRGRCAALGPLVDPRTTPCLDCLTADDEEDDRTAGVGDHELAAAMFARDVFAAVSRTTPTPLPMRWRLVDLETLGQRDTASATRPGCPRCSAAEGPVVERAAPATRFEASVAMPPKEFADLKAHQMHYKPSNLALQRVSRTWPVAPAVELPPPDHARLDRSDPPRDAARPGPDTLSLLLSVTAGIRADNPDKVARWTASGGNIGSVTAYAVVRDVPGITPGVYGYVTSGHRLARLSSRADALPGDQPFSIVLTGDFPKVARKYSAFALRIVLLDSGCAQATAREAAHTLGIGFALRPRWDDEAIAATLGINPDMEPVTAVIDLGGTA
ncbi:MULTISPECIES: tpaE [unclassified Streptomyces]|uniref:tpaE n=1 Tax=unclassified Streptomyces TaxID=2593676 RepID=UPI001BE84558|nr:MULTISPECIES: tpaE [unclassified Streptomyces]MBT2406289.1 tpaE [Streptomyces sp. ISL-21]MBT2607394.1 tpaE [Streptomyces sp. ISL-87]